MILNWCMGVSGILIAKFNDSAHPAYLQIITDTETSMLMA